LRFHGRHKSLIGNSKVIHLDNGWDWSTQEWFYSSVLKQGPLSTSDFDMMGVSFYPVSPENRIIWIIIITINIFFSSSKPPDEFELKSCLSVA
jgi:hypothetical protein